MTGKTDLYEFSKEDAFRFADEQGAKYTKKCNELQFMFCPYCHGGGESEVCAW